MRLFTIFTFIAVLVLSSAAQSVTAPKWTTVTSKKGELSVTLPSDFLIFNEDDRDQVTLLSGLPGSSYKVSIAETSRGKARLDSMRQYPSEIETEVSRFEVGDFVIDTYTFGKKPHSLSIYIASSSGFYSIDVSSTEPSDRNLAAVMTSVLLNGKPLLTKSGVVAPRADASVSVKSLKTSQLIKDALKHKQIQKIVVQKHGVFSPEKDTDFVYSRPFMVLSKPRASYTDSARQSNISGTVELKIIFKGNGDIGSITVVNGLEGGLSNEAVEAAKKIKFLPAEIDGKPVDVTKLVKYSFSIY